MRPLPLTPESVIKKSPFLVARQISDNEVRVYSRLHGNMRSFGPEIFAVLKIFDSPVDVGSAVKELGEARSDAMAMIEELYGRRFLVDADQAMEAMFAEYVDAARRNNEVPRVTKINFLVSATCNLACQGCYHTFYDFKSQDMDVGFADSVFKGLFPYLKRKGIPAALISFLGYEPFMNFEVMRDICSRARHMGEKYAIDVTFKIFTNGFGFSDRMFDWLVQNKDRVSLKVSLDGIRADNDRRRVDRSGAGTYDRVVANIGRILSAGVHCGVLIVLSKLNLPNIEKFVDEMAAMGVRHITANIFCGQSDDERKLELSEDEKLEAIRRMDLATEKHGIEFDGEFKFAVLQMITGAHFTCPAGLKQLVFCADGAIHPCQRFAGTRVNFGKYDNRFWDDLLAGECQAYKDWNNELYDGVMERIGGDNADLTGWSCPFIPFLRGQCLSTNVERKFNERLLDYYITRPIDRIISKSRIEC
ncbi:MAG: 4Fe-4S cluster-binding domain-containing protein [Syntrophorhabdaceae bacterium]|nr:4Fe-4S cluster-binding domain-containing protein [Syntrophorhabdaceae bacterium]MDD4195507.1 4Fe-4S cluster-binding domain-containing protein [Syntrophorhabdaceae bacterium]HOC45654.1 4Fe-4S cluster-binding domain-containing protein [Syntrophorhabdaceae bacterium]